MEIGLKLEIYFGLKIFFYNNQNSIDRLPNQNQT